VGLSALEGGVGGVEPWKGGVELLGLSAPLPPRPLLRRRIEVSAGRTWGEGNQHHHYHHHHHHHHHLRMNIITIPLLLLLLLTMEGGPCARMEPSGASRMV
jgi:hypothetical protein